MDRAGRCPPTRAGFVIDQAQAPTLDALAYAAAHPLTGFGAPGHERGRVIPTGLGRLLGRGVFAADLLTPKGLDDRTESGHVLQRAHEIAAEAWGADICRFATAGTTQSLHTVLAAVVPPGSTVLLAGHCHKAAWASVLFAGYRPVVLPTTIDEDWDLEHGVATGTLIAALDAHPEARAVLVVSPSYFGVTCNVPALAAVAHARGVPLIVDAAWGGAFGFSSRLPASPLAQGADIMVASLHKTMGALGQGSVMLARGSLVDQERLALAYELFQTTSPSTAILASLDATRRDHALHGARLWGDVLDVAADGRKRLAMIDGVSVWGRERLDGDAAFDLDESKLLIDVARLGVAGYAIDDWLAAEHKVNVGLSGARHLLAIVKLATSHGDVRRLARGLKDLVARLQETPEMLPAAPQDLPRIGALGMDMVMAPSDAFFAPAEKVPVNQAEGRIAAEIIAPAPPAIPRLIPGQRITAVHAQFLDSNRRAGMFVLDPADPSEHAIRVVR